MKEVNFINFRLTFDVLEGIAVSITIVLPKEKIYTWFEAPYQLEVNDNVGKNQVDASGYLYNTYLNIREFARENGIKVERKKPPKSQQSKLKCFYTYKYFFYLD